jgi:translation elongation factor EF-1alpha
LLRYDEIVGKLSPFLKGTGYNMKTDVTFIPVSGFTGANIKEPVGSVAPWVEYVPSLSLRPFSADLFLPFAEASPSSRSSTTSPSRTARTTRHS